MKVLRRQTIYVMHGFQSKPVYFSIISALEETEQEGVGTTGSER
jgi:hypothetical protein